MPENLSEDAPPFEQRSVDFIRLMEKNLWELEVVRQARKGIFIVPCDRAQDITYYLGRKHENPRNFLPEETMEKKILKEAALRNPE